MMDPAPRRDVELVRVVDTHDKQIVVGDRRNALKQSDNACGEQQNCCCKRRTYRETLPDRVIRGFPRWSSHQRSFRQNALPILSLEGLGSENITRRG